MIRPRSHAIVRGLIAVATLALVSASPALASSFGVGAVATEWDPALNQNPGDFYDSDPGDYDINEILSIFSAAYSTGETLANATFNGDFGRANLAAGTLRAFASSSVVAAVSVGFSDTLTAAEDGVLHFTLAIDGTVLGNGSSSAWFAIDDDGFLEKRDIKLGQLGEGESNECLAPLAAGCTYAFDVDVSEGQAIRFFAAIQAFVDDATVDMSNTATLRAIGVGFTSASGVFQTDPGPTADPSVPEPATVALLGSGLVAVSRRAARRRS
jgi:hypothetical protein